MDALKRSRRVDDESSSSSSSDEYETEEDEEEEEGVLDDDDNPLGVSGIWFQDRSQATAVNCLRSTFHSFQV
jgi:hypothetical protein